MEPKNDPLEIDRRKYQNMLAACGGAVMAFGVWYMVRIIMEFSFETTFSSALDDMTAGDKLIKAVSLAIIFIVYFVSMLLRVYVGKRAAKEAKEGKKGNFYVVCNFLFILISISGIFMNIREIQTGMIVSITDYIAEFLIEVSSIAASVTLFYSVICLRRTERSLLHE